MAGERSSGEVRNMTGERRGNPERDVRRKELTKGKNSFCRDA
jgi:hypothetical protein